MDSIIDVIVWTALVILEAGIVVFGLEYGIMESLHFPKGLEYGVFALSTVGLAYLAFIIARHGYRPAESMIEESE